MRAKILRKLRGEVWASGLPLLIGVFVVAAALALSYSPSVIPPLPADAQGTGTVPNMAGWAWSSNIGWISVSCDNPGAGGCAADGGQNWGLTLESPVPSELGGEPNRRYISGFAWNDKIGWIKFDPEGPGDLTPDANYPSQVNTVASRTYWDLETDRVVGWARACNVFASGCTGPLKSNSQRGDWDGWISIGQTNSVAGGAGNTQNPYGVRVERVIRNNGINFDFKYFAWGQTVIGWMNTGGAFGITCPPGNPLCPESQPPTVSLQADQTCIAGGAETAVRLTWQVGNNAAWCNASASPEDTEWDGSKAEANGSHQQTVGISDSTTFFLSCGNSAAATAAQPVSVPRCNEQDKNLTVIPLGSGAGSVTSNPRGRSNGILCQYSFLSGISGICSDYFTTNTSVNLAAAPEAGSNFDDWLSDDIPLACVAEPTPANCNGIIMSKNIDVWAIFDKIGVITLTIGHTGPGSGTVTADDDNSGFQFSCGPFCGGVSSILPLNSQFTITATPAPGSTFDHWVAGSDAACTGNTNPCRVTMSQNRNAIAWFNSGGGNEMRLTLTGNRAGAVVLNNNNALVCNKPASTPSVTCVKTNADLVALGAPSNAAELRASVSDFQGWGGTGGCSGTGTCSVNLSTASKEITADFSGGGGCSPNCPRTVTVTVSGTGSVKEGSNMCSNSTSPCTWNYPSGEGDTISIGVDSGSLSSWGQDCSTATGNSCSLTLDTNKNVTANFPSCTGCCGSGCPNPDLTVVAARDTNNPGSGKVTATGISCWTSDLNNPAQDCGQSYSGVQTVVLDADPEAGSTVVWSGCTSVSGNECTISVNSDKTVTATFSSSGQPLCLADVSVQGIDTMTVDLPGTGYVISPNSLILAMTANVANIGVNITTYSDEVNAESDHTNLDSKMCIMSTTDKPTPANCTNTNSTTLTTSKRNRLLWMHVPDPSRPGVNEASSYLDCNDDNGNKGCRVKVTVAPVDNGTCDPAPRDVYYYVNFTDSTIAPKSVGN